MICVLKGQINLISSKEKKKEMDFYTFDTSMKLYESIIPVVIKENCQLNSISQKIGR